MILIDVLLPFDNTYSERLIDQVSLMSSSPGAQSADPLKPLDPLVIPSELWLETICHLEAKDTLSLSSVCIRIHYVLILSLYLTRFLDI
jgi:hypothetical protein